MSPSFLYTVVDYGVRPVIRKGEPLQRLVVAKAKVVSETELSYRITDMEGESRPAAFGFRKVVNKGEYAETEKGAWERYLCLLEAESRTIDARRRDLDGLLSVVEFRLRPFKIKEASS